jgi:Tfp pilus assembly PilM family ATPase
MSKDPEKDIIMKISAILPPPASSIGPIHCAGCGAENPAHKKFCGKCGNHLWDPCINCGESNSADEEYCGNCGTNLKDALSSVAERIDKDIAQARLLMKEYRYAEAISLLKPITTSKYTCLTPCARRASDLFEQCMDIQREWTSRIRKMEGEIKQFISAGDIERAVLRIKDMPEIFRSLELCDLLQNLQRQQSEMAALSKAIAFLSEQSLTMELVDKVERLLLLQPDNEKALKQASAINRGAMRKSKRLVLNGDFEKALGILDQVPMVFRDDEFRGFREQTCDLAYMAWDIEHAPFVDKTLLEFSRRLRKFLPEGSKYTGLCKKLAVLEEKAQSLKPVSRRWAEYPQMTVSDSPMEFLNDLGPVHISSNASTTTLANNAGRLAVACGLALQGLGLAPVKINLRQEKSWMGNIGRWLPKRRAQSAWGVEISSSGIKAVKLCSRHGASGEPGSKQDAVILQECRIIEHRRRLNQSANDKDRDSVLDETLQKFLKQNPPGDEPVILGLPDWMVLLKIAELPSMPVAIRKAAIAHEVGHLFPRPLPDVAWKHICFESMGNSEPRKQSLTVAYVGVRQMMLKEFLARWSKMGLNIDGVQCDMAALYNFAMFRAADQINHPITLVDLGSDRLNILVCSPRQIWHRSVMFGSDRINKALVRELKLTHAQAEQWKCNPALAPTPGKFYEILQPIYEDYVQETLDSLAAYQKAFPDEKVGRIIGCGGGFLTHDLPRYFLWRR